MWCRTWLEKRSRQVRRASLSTEDLEDAKLRLASWVIANQEMRRAQPDGVAFETCLLRYYQHQARHLRSADQARHAILRLSNLFPGALVSEFTVERQRQFASALRTENLSDGYIRRTLAVAQAALNRALREGEIAEAPHVDLKLAPESEPRERILSLDETARLFAASPLEHLQMYLMLAFGTAGRPEAILQLTTFQVDCGARIIRLNPPDRPQTKKRRPTIPMCETLLPLLRGLPVGPIVRYNGRPLASIRTAFRKARDRAGLSRDVTPYTIRHTMASEMRKRDVPVWEVAGFLGHSSGYRTTERYAKYGPDHLSKAVQAIDSFFADLAAACAPSPDHSIHRSRASCVLPGQFHEARLPSNPLVGLVEPDGIEPTTSTMPL
jgi:integrase